MLWHLSEKGTAAIVEFPGVLYRGGDEKRIRQYLIKNNFVDTVIQLPSNLFFGVGIATCIIVLKKSAKTDASVLFIDASKLFQKNGNKNLLLPEHQDKIMDLFVNRKDEDYLAKLVKNDDILANDCNLSVSSYVEQEDTREVIDINAVNARLETYERLHTRDGYGLLVYRRRASHSCWRQNLQGGLAVLPPAIAMHGSHRAEDN
jgi:type I restriction enzyme M protein